VVIEAKNRRLSWPQIREELDSAKRNRGAAVALAIFAPEHAPKGVAPFDVRYGHVLCVVDPESPDATALSAAVRLARLYALAATADDDDRVDVARVSAALEAVKAELEAVRRLKTSLTAIRSTATEVSSGLDKMREGILARVADAEASLRASAAS
jgi:hypothetical protein